MLQCAGAPGDRCGLPIRTAVTQSVTAQAEAIRRQRSADGGAPEGPNHWRDCRRAELRRLDCIAITRGIEPCPERKTDPWRLIRSQATRSNNRRAAAPSPINYPVQLAGSPPGTSRARFAPGSSLLAALTWSCPRVSPGASRRHSIEAAAMFLRDTNVVSGLLRPSPEPMVEAWVADRLATDLYFSAISEAEVRYGVAVFPAGRQRAALAAAIESILREDFADRILPFDSAAARGVCEHRGGTTFCWPHCSASGLSDRGDCLLARHGRGHPQRPGLPGHRGRSRRSLDGDIGRTTKTARVTNSTNRLKTRRAGT